MNHSEYSPEDVEIDKALGRMGIDPVSFSLAARDKTRKDVRGMIDTGLTFDNQDEIGQLEQTIKLWIKEHSV